VRNVQASADTSAQLSQDPAVSEDDDNGEDDSVSPLRRVRLAEGPEIHLTSPRRPSQVREYSLDPHGQSAANSDRRCSIEYIYDLFDRDRACRPAALSEGSSACTSARESAPVDADGSEGRWKSRDDDQALDGNSPAVAAWRPGLQRRHSQSEEESDDSAQSEEVDLGLSETGCNASSVRQAAQRCSRAIGASEQRLSNTRYTRMSVSNDDANRRCSIEDMYELMFEQDMNHVERPSLRSAGTMSITELELIRTDESGAELGTEATAGSSPKGWAKRSFEDVYELYDESPRGGWRRTQAKGRDIEPSTEALR